MIVSIGIVYLSKPHKAVQVQLSLKACQLGLIKIAVMVKKSKRQRRHEQSAGVNANMTSCLPLDLPRHHLFDKLLGFTDDKAAAMRLPRDDVRIVIFLHLFEDLVQLDGKRQCHTASLSLRRRFREISTTSVFLMGVIVVVVLDEMSVMHLGRLAVSQLAATSAVVAVAAAVAVAVAGGRVHHGRWSIH